MLEAAPRRPLERGRAATDARAVGSAVAAAGMRLTFAVATVQVVIALAQATGSRWVALRVPHAGHQGAQDSGAE